MDTQIENAETTFPDGTKWSISGRTITCHNHPQTGQDESWTFDSDKEAVTAWVAVLTH